MQGKLSCMSVVKTNVTSFEVSYLSLIKQVFQLLGKNKLPYLFWLIIYSIFSSWNYLYIYIFARFIDYLAKNTTSYDNTTLFSYIGTLAIVITTGSVVATISKFQSYNIEMRTLLDTRDISIQKFTAFPLNWHQKDNSGGQVEKINNGTRMMRIMLRIFRMQVLSIVIAITTAIISFIVLDWKYIIFAFIYASMRLWLERYYNKKIEPIVTQMNKTSEKGAGVFFEFGTNITTIKATNSNETMHPKIMEQLKKNFELDRQRTAFDFRKQVLGTLLNCFAMIIFVYLLSMNYYSGLITVGLIFTYVTYFGHLRMAIQQLTDLMENLVEYKAAIARILPILNDKPEKYFGQDTFPVNWQQIIFKNVNFHYKTNENAKKTIKTIEAIQTTNQANLDNINLTINRGEKIGIVGRSGSGKSTLAKLLIGLDKIDNGEILIDNEDFYSFDHKQITEHFHLVLQHTELFNLSLRDNLTFLKTIDQKRIDQAIKIAQLENIVAKLPDKLETKVGEKGYKLSGGEKQRVGIARSITSNYDLIIFDEATSSLDTETEGLIQESIDTQLQDKTLIVIAHRLSTLKNMDRIIVFDKGKIIEEGNFTDLLNNPNSHFAYLWSLQKINEL
jgi:ABC-type multidrug transport system fused ATPase/permease subunit